MRKFWMALSGLVMVGYLLIHMYGNLKMFAGKTATGEYAYDAYAHHLRVMGEPLLPENGLLWIVRVVLLAAILVHIWSAFTLWSRAKKASGGSRRYAHSKAIQRSYASYTMRWGGVTILLFVIYHILHFTVPVIDTAPGAASIFPRVVESFQQPLVLISYLIAMIAVGLHIRHGFWSAFATLGANTSPKSRAIWNTVAIIIALAIVLGFVAGPIAIFFGGITL
ncbi:succinate dehydrogenase cytochrome b subunit [Granulicoccus sp. GXG6511]|uniref:succinate dehydrogenase cytochrome b subunit n=1 Tax=Granulicoccus sp. GXG6511 TaxID=3381351 RepID=UPI003D7EAEBE